MWFFCTEKRVYNIFAGHSSLQRLDGCDGKDGRPTSGVRGVKVNHASFWRYTLSYTSGETETRVTGVKHLRRCTNEGMPIAANKARAKI